MEVGSPPPPPLPKKSAPPGQLEQPPSRIGTKLSPEPPGSKPEPQDSKCELPPPPCARPLAVSVLWGGIGLAGGFTARKRHGGSSLQLQALRGGLGAASGLMAPRLPRAVAFLRLFRLGEGG